MRDEYNTNLQMSSSESFETHAGQLPCRRILFLQWQINQSSNEKFYSSIRNFVGKAVQHAIKAHYTSIAFPSIGCGQLNIDKNIVANEMLAEAQTQLLSANVLLQINFVILPEQADVFQTFREKLESLQRGDVQENNVQIEYKHTSKY